MIDRKAVRERFLGLSREELIEETLRGEEYTAAAREILESVLHERGVTAGEVGARRQASAPPRPEAVVDSPALLVSAMEEGHLQELAAALRSAGIPATVRELDLRSCGQGGPPIGRWGVVVPGARAAEAGRILDALLPPPAEGPGAPGCADGCASCREEPPPTGEEWPEDGDWWQTNPSAADGEER
jgi:hypothetical protein